MKVIKKILFSMSKLLPDSLYLKIRFKQVMKTKLHLKKPKTFNEKLQWLKIHDRKAIYTTMSDKYEAKQFVSSVIGEQFIVRTIGVWERFEDINFDDLPEAFVLKCTHDSGGLVICTNKKDLDFEQARQKINKSLKKNYYYLSREWPYKNIKPKIIAEEYLHDDNDSNDLTDYKFYCFNGEPKFLYISKGLKNHSTARISFVTLDWKFAPFSRSDYRPLEQLPPKPKKFDEMIRIAKMLSKNCKFLRVDLYYVDDSIYFSELTFFPCGGMMPFSNKNDDLELGKMINLCSEE